MPPLTFAQVESLAQAVGLDAVGVSEARPTPELEAPFRDWLSRGFHGEMRYLERNMPIRLDPQRLLPGCLTVITALLSYHLPGVPPSPEAPRVARFARIEDYHHLLRQRLYSLLQGLNMHLGEKVEGRAVVDSAPFPDRLWAKRAGLGWIGKHGLLIHPELGSYVVIGSLLVNRAIESTIPEMRNRCGSCTRCLTACPRDALLAPGLMDARRCTSYLTIEQKSPLSDEEISGTFPWAFGCDACQEACPWNRKARYGGLNPSFVLSNEDLQALARGDSPPPRRSPLRRAKRGRLRYLLWRHTQAAASQETTGQN